jgi:hypothetical protein
MGWACPLGCDYKLHGIMLNTSAGLSGGIAVG